MEWDGDGGGTVGDGVCCAVLCCAVLCCAVLWCDGMRCDVLFLYYEKSITSAANVNLTK